MADISSSRYLDVLLLHHICKVALAKTATKLELTHAAHQQYANHPEIFF
jgi:hypothetical protein